MWKRVIKTSLLVAFLLPAISSWGVEEDPGSVPRDESTPIELRQPPREKIDKFMNDEDFLYDKVPPPSETMLESIRRKFGETMRDAFDWKGSDLFFDLLIYLLIIAAIVGAVLLVVKSNMQAVFTGKSVEVDKIGFEEFEEDIHEIDFDKLIREAIDQQDYRRAVRLYYLKALKEMSNLGLIAWKPEKTNLEYQDELRDSALHTPFRDVSYLYEYTWYGNFGVTKNMFGNISDRFRGFIGKLKPAHVQG